MKKFILIAITMLTIFSCKTKKEKAISNHWKYQEGYHIGDVIDFDNNYYVIDDSCKIYVQGVYTCKVKRVSSKELEIESPDKKIGYYIFLKKSKQ